MSKEVVAPKKIETKVSSQTVPGPEVKTAVTALVVPAVPPAPKEPMLKVDMKRALEGLRGKTTLPIETEFTVNEKIKFNAYQALIASVDSILGKWDGKVIAISRQPILNRMCLAQKITPLNCKKENKTENATISTYGVVPVTENTFDVGGDTYRLFGFLKHPILTASNWVAFKYGTYMVVLSTAEYANFSAGKMLEDVNIRLIEK